MFDERLRVSKGSYFTLIDAIVAYTEIVEFDGNRSGC